MKPKKKNHSAKWWRKNFPSVYTYVEDGYIWYDAINILYCEN